MPTYTYVCDHCKHKLDACQKYDDVPLKKCPECKRQKLRKTFTPPAIHFKGTGWTPKGNNL